MAKTVQMVHHHTFQGVDYLPGDIVELTDAQARQFIRTGLAFAIPWGTPPTTKPNPFPMYVTIPELADALGNLGDDEGLLALRDAAIAARNDAVEAAADAAGSALPTTQLIDNRVSRRVSSPAEKGLVLYADSFNRPNGPLDGTKAPTGGTYDGDDATEKVKDGFYTPDCHTGAAKITYNQIDSTPTALVMHVKFNPVSDDLDNFVIGSCPVGFGKGSVQLATNADELYLFIVAKDPADPTGVAYIHGTHPLTGAPTEYQVIAAIDYDEPMLRDGKTTYPCEVHFDLETSTATLVSYEGKKVSITDPQIVQWLGRQIGIQGRSPGDNGEIGGMAYAAAHGVETAGEQPFAGALLRITDKDTYAETPAPAWTPSGDIDMQFDGAAVDWTASPALQNLFYQAGGLLWEIRNDKPYLSVTLADGTTTAVAGTQAFTFADKARGLIRVTRTAADGVVKFWTCPTRDGVTWVQHGLDRSTTAGVPVNSGSPFMVGHRAPGNPFVGDVARFTLKDGIGGTIKAEVDFTKTFNGTGAAGNRWTLHRPLWAAAAGVLDYVTAKGDLLGATGGGALARIPGGVNGGILTRDDAEATGWKVAAPSGLVLSQLRPSAVSPQVSGTTSATPLWTPPLIPAASLDATKTLFTLEIDGNIDTIAATGGIVSVWLDINGTQVFSAAMAPQQTSAATNLLWSLAGKLYVTATGATGKVAFFGRASCVTSAAGARGSIAISEKEVAVDLTGGLQVTIKGKLASTDPGVIMRQHAAALQQLA